MHRGLLSERQQRQQQRQFCEVWEFWNISTIRFRVRMSTSDTLQPAIASWCLRFAACVSAHTHKKNKLSIFPCRNELPPQIHHRQHATIAYLLQVSANEHLLGVGFVVICAMKDHSKRSTSPLRGLIPSVVRYSSQNTRNHTLWPNHGNVTKARRLLLT